VEDFGGTFCPRVAAARALLMLVKSALHIRGDAGVDALVVALDEIDEVHMRYSRRLRQRLLGNFLPQCAHTAQRLHTEVESDEEDQSENLVHDEEAVRRYIGVVELKPIKFEDEDRRAGDGHVRDTDPQLARVCEPCQKYDEYDGKKREYGRLGDAGAEIRVCDQHDDGAQEEQPPNNVSVVVSRGGHGFMIP